MRYTSPIFQKAADVIEELIDSLIDVCAENSAYEVANEILKEKLERANHCINEISDQFERGKCSNDYVEEILKEYYEND